MGHKMPIVCKRVILPISNDDDKLTLEEYKQKYGIDLTQFIELDSDNIYLKNENIEFLVRDFADYSERIQRMPVFSPMIKTQTYNSGTDDGYLAFCSFTPSLSEGLGAYVIPNLCLVMAVSSDKAFALENIRISHGDIY